MFPAHTNDLLLRAGLGAMRWFPTSHLHVTGATYNAFGRLVCLNYRTYVFLVFGHKSLRNYMPNKSCQTQTVMTQKRLLFVLQGQHARRGVLTAYSLLSRLAIYAALYSLLFTELLVEKWKKKERKQRITSKLT